MKRPRLSAIPWGRRAHGFRMCWMITRIRNRFLTAGAGGEQFTKTLGRVIQPQPFSAEEWARIDQVQEQDKVRAATEFLAGRIAAEGERQSLPLTEVEHKMLYWARSGWTLPGMDDVHEVFERDYNRAAYEKKIQFLIRRYLDRVRAGEEYEYESWNNAVETLRNEDRYIRRLVAGARGPGRLTDIVITALVVAAVILAAMYLANLR
jgi:hypothetical protein